jgi:hypothetical protein
MMVIDLKPPSFDIKDASPANPDIVHKQNVSDDSELRT